MSNPRIDREGGGDRLEKDLRGAIAQGRLAPHDRIAPLRELAREYSIPSSRAQRVVKRLEREGLLHIRHGHGAFVAPKACPEGGAPTGGTPHLALLLAHDQSWELEAGRSGTGMTDFIRGLESSIGPSGTGFAIIQTPPEPALEALPPLVRDVAAVAFFNGSRLGLCPLQDELAQGRQLLIFAGEAPSARAGTLALTVDAPRGIAAAVEHLLALGHRHIACATWDSTGPMGAHAWPQERVEAYRTALAAHGLEPAVFHVPSADHKQAVGLPRQTLGLFQEMLAEGATPVTAVACVNDSLAALLLRSASQLGFAVPRDFSLIGFDDAPVAVGLSLTTLHRPHRAMGELAGLLARRTAEGQCRLSGQIALHPELVIRGTSAPPPSPR